jgi:hypothetical protein
VEADAAAVAAGARDVGPRELEVGVEHPAAGIGELAVYKSDINMRVL